MKIMQINLWSGRIQRPLLGLIERERPDIVFCQEVFSFPGNVAPDSPWATWRTADLMAQRGELSPKLYEKIVKAAKTADEKSAGPTSASTLRCSQSVRP